MKSDKTDDKKPITAEELKKVAKHLSKNRRPTPTEERNKAWFAKAKKKELA